MQVFFNSPEIQREMNRMKTFALSNVYDFSHGIIPDDHVPAGDNPDHFCINGTTKVVYSIEIQPNEKLGQCHHLSVSKQGTKTPNPIIINEVMKQFGMGDLEDGKPRKLWLEGEAVNILQPMREEKICLN